MQVQTVVILLIISAWQGTAYAPKSKVKGRTPFGLSVSTTPQNTARDVYVKDAPKDDRKDNHPKSTGSEMKKVLYSYSKQKWGVDKVYTEEYWFDDRIHTLGNIGIGGALHAALAPFATKLIDIKAYGGVDIRAKAARKLSKIVGTSHARVVDLCCGVGISTRALRDAFTDAEAVIGLDSSPQMIAMAKFLAQHLSFFKPVTEYMSNLFSKAAKETQQQKAKIVDRVDGICKLPSFVRGNSEETHLPDKRFDLVTIMYALHEVPKAGRHRILQEARRLLKPGGTLAVVDISTEYTPSQTMLSGEPYVIEYQKNIHAQIKEFKGFFRPRYETLVPGHVGMWLLQRA